MAYEMLVGLEISDPKIYSQYREAMTPILKRFGGSFRYDFTIAEVLKRETDNPINRVFTIYFADQASRDAFFSDSDYKKAKEKFFEKSVKATTIIAEYHRTD